jgi:hypothetical protein
VHGECEGGKRSMGKGGGRNKEERMNGKKKEKKKKKWKSKGKVEQGRAKKSGICAMCKREMGKSNLKKKNKKMKKS